MKLSKTLGTFALVEHQYTSFWTLLNSNQLSVANRITAIVAFEMKELTSLYTRARLKTSPGRAFLFASLSRQ